MDDQVVLKQGEIFVRVEFVELCQETRAYNHISVCLRISEMFKQLQDRYFALQIFQLVTGIDIVFFGIIICAFLFLVSCNCGRNRRLVGKAVVDLLLGFLF